MSTVHAGYTTEEQRSVMIFVWAKGLNAKDVHKEMFPVCGRKCLSRKAVYNWVKKFSQGHSKVTDDETEMRKWLRQQSEDCYAVGLDALVKRWDKCISVVEKYFFFQFRISHILCFISICHLFTDYPSYYPASKWATTAFFHNFFQFGCFVITLRLFFYNLVINAIK
jgi:hypothetical protein